MDVRPAMELADYLDSRFHGNDKEGCGNNRGRGNDRGEADEDIRLLKIPKRPSVNLNCSGNAAGSVLQTILEAKMISRGWWISWK